MPRLNLYEMANPFRAPRSSGADFGAAPAQALEGFGDEALKIGERIQRREENAISDKVFGEVNTQALPLLNDFEKKHDIALPQALNEFQGAMQKIKADALSKATLRPEARAALERQLDNQITQYGKSAIGMRIKAGNDAMVARLNEQFDTGVNQVSAAPSIMKDVIDTNVAFVESRKDSMDPLMYQAAIKKAHAGPIQAAVNSYLAQQLPDKADELLQNPEINKLIDPDALRPLRINVAVEKGKQEAETKRQDLNVQKFQMRLGRELTPEETIKARSLPAKKDMTPTDEITELELVQGKPASQDQVDKIFKTYIDGGKDAGGAFGNSLRGRSIAFVNDNAVAYANGLLTPDKARQFESSYAEAYMPKNREDPVTGTVQKITPTAPKFAEEAMRRGSAIYGGLSAGVTQPSGVGGRQNELEYAASLLNGRLGTVAIPPSSPFYDQSQPPGQTSMVPAATESPVKGRGLWSMASKIAGPVAGVARWWGSGPIPMGMGQEEVAAEQYVINQQKSLVRALQQNPRYAEGERKSIEQDIAIKPEAFGNERAVQLRLVEIGKYIDEELRFNAKVLQNPTGTTVQQRQQAMQSNAALSQFYDQLELPPKVKSLAEAEKLPSNVEEFIDENWILRDGPARRRK